MCIKGTISRSPDLPIGGVALVDRHVSPSYVGYDIGCGMCAINTGLLAADLLPDDRSKKELFALILKHIPVGLGGRRDRAPFPAFESEVNDPAFTTKVSRGVQTQLGTLDEAPFAYKEIRGVIAAQDGVVIKVRDHLQPIINIKG